MVSLCLSSIKLHQLTVTINLTINVINSKGKIRKKNEANINFTHFHRKKRLKLSKSKDWLCGTVTQTEKNINMDILSV